MHPITLRSLKYDGSLHRMGEVFLLGESEGAWLCYHPANRTVQTGKGNYLSVYPMISWRWPDRWWDATLVFTPEGDWLEWYCNILTPPIRDGDTITFTDLDLDVVQHRERGLHIADEDELEQHAAEMGYPPDIVARATHEAHALRDLIAAGGWRFGEDVTTLTLDEALARQW